MWSVLLLVSICGLVHGLYRTDPLVSTKRGIIRGQWSEHGHAQFLGIPYGVVNRINPFGLSTPYPNFDEIFDAHQSTVCPQVNRNAATGTIDCLTLNIYVPEVSITNSRIRLPVMVWMHGGAFVEGNGASQAHTSQSLLKNDVIVVAINYRLGVYGFMCLDIPEVPGNQGLKDQLIALRWIKENIEAFGGDANQITAFGESAGGMSVNLHLLSPHEKLFEKAIIQSGPAVSPWMMVESENTIPIRLAREFGFHATRVTEALAFLSTVDPLEVVIVAQNLLITSASQSNQPLTKPCVEKIFEGVENFVTEHSMYVYTSKVRTTPIMIGNNNDEFAFQYETKDAEFFSTYHFDQVLGLSFDLNNNLEDALNAIKHFYNGDKEISEDVKLDLIDFGSDLVFNHATQRMAEQFLDNGAPIVYRYLFSYSGGRNLLKFRMNLNTTGATHADELGYLFDMDIFGETSSEDQLVADRITTLWANFAKYGNPTPETSELLPVKWEPITKTTQPYLDINANLTLQSRPFHDRMAFWDLFYRLYGIYQKW